MAPGGPGRTTSMSQDVRSDGRFKIISHRVPATYIREHAYDIIAEDRDLHLAVNQYVPIIDHGFSHGSNESQDVHELTIVAVAGTGFHKELYEPLFALLHDSLRKRGRRIRSIWIADAVNVGESAVLNRQNLGCDPYWFDHSRDLGAIIQHLRHEMPRPIFGLAHSMGAAQMAYLTHLHPRLFTSMVLIEPGIDPDFGKKIIWPWTLRTALSRDGWPSRAEAENALAGPRTKEGWSPEVVKRVSQYGIFYDADEPPETRWRRTTSPRQEAMILVRPNAMANLHPEEDGTIRGGDGRPERHEIWDLMPHFRPRILYVNGSSSPFFGDPAVRSARANLTGTAADGNGGIESGAVQQVVVQEAGHMLVFQDEYMGIVAENAAEYLTQEAKRWEEGEWAEREKWTKELSLKQRQDLPKGYVESLKKQVQQQKEMRQQKAKL